MVGKIIKNNVKRTLSQALYGIALREKVSINKKMLSWAPLCEQWPCPYDS